MNPDVKAARDRLAAELASPGPHHFAVGDVRTVLAALDQQPTAIIATEAVMSETEYEDLKQRFLVQQQGTPRMRMANEALRCADAVEDLRDAARHGTDGPIRDWARHALDNAGLAWRPQPKTSDQSLEEGAP